MQSSPENYQQLKQEYLKCIESFEKKQLKMREMVAQLRHSVSQISIAGNGVNAELDRMLATLRKEIRAGKPHAQIQSQINEICDQLRRLNEDKDTERTAVHVVLEKLLGALGKLPINNDLAKQVKLLEQDIKSNAAGKTIGLYVKEFALLQKSIIISKQAEKNNQPLPSSNADSSVPPDVSHSLTSLMDHLEFNDDAKASADVIKQRLSESLNIDDLDGIIKQIINLIVENAEVDKEKFECFLSQLNNRLTDMQSFLTDSQTTQDDSLDNTRQLNQSVQDDVTHIQQSLKTVGSIDELSGLVGNRIDNISNRLEEFKLAEEDRASEHRKRIQELEQRIQATELESENLKEHLESQKHLAQHDPLTGLPNRIAYNERVEQARSEACENSSSFYLAVADIDHFKNINDAFGHQAGDKVLKKIAALISSVLGHNDFVARIGGEEFVLLIPTNELKYAEALMQKIRETIESCKFHFRGKPVQISISIGLTEFTHNEVEPEVFARADKALYEAKQNGRNRVITISRE